MDRTERITIEIDENTKKRFNAILEQNGQTASKIIRLNIQQYILMNSKIGECPIDEETQGLIYEEETHDNA